MRTENIIISSILEATKKRLKKKRSPVEPATEEGLVNNVNESAVYPFVTGDFVSSTKNGPGKVTAHGMKTFVVRYNNGKKGLHDQSSTHRWTENGLDNEDNVKHLNEVSNELLHRYSIKSAREAERAEHNAKNLRRAADETAVLAHHMFNRHTPKDDFEGGKLLDKARALAYTSEHQAELALRRGDGLQRASEKILSRLKEGRLDEISSGTLGDYVERSLVDREHLRKDLDRITRDGDVLNDIKVGNRSGADLKDALADHLSKMGRAKQDKIDRRGTGILRALERMKNGAIEEDRIDEISNDSIVSYLKNAIRNKEEHDVDATRALDLARLVGGEMRDHQLASAEKHHNKSEKRGRGLMSAIAKLSNSPIDEEKREKHPDQVVMTSSIRKDLGGGIMAKTRDGKFYKLDVDSLKGRLPEINSVLDIKPHKFIGQDDVDLKLLKEALS